MRSRLVIAALALALGAPSGTAPAGAADGGVWLPTLKATQGFDHLSALSNGTFYAQYLDTYARSRDHGKTWEVMPRPTGQYLGSPGIRFATPTIGFSVGGGPGLESLLLGDTEFAEEVKRCGGIQPLRRTTDGGTTWRAICMPRTQPTSDPRFGPGASPLTVGMGGRTIVVSGSEHPLKFDPLARCDKDYDVIYTSLDAGARWNRAALPPGNFGGFRQYLYGASTIARLTYTAWERTDDNGCSSATSALFLSRDGGKSFKKVYTCAQPSLCTAVALPSRDKIILGRNDGSTMISSDAGRTWRRGQRLWDARNDAVVASGQLSPHAFWVQAMSFVDAKHGFASTRGAGTWRTADGGISWEQEKSHECQWFLHGIGEIAGGTKDTAITGGPEFISARVPVADAPGGCGATQPQLGAVRASDVVADLVTARGTFGVRVDGSMTVDLR